MKSTLSIMIACPHPLKAQGIAGIVRGGGHTVHCVVSDIDNVSGTAKPDIIVVDGCLCGDEMQTVKDLVHSGAGTVVVLAGAEREGTFIQHALRAGARGCLCCDDSADRFLHSIELLAQGAVVISREHSEHLTGHPTSSDTTRQLTRREQQIAAMVARGATNKETADELFLSVHTVKVHIRNILDKLDLRNRQQLASYIAREGLIEGAPDSG
ncbi:MAG: LuxR C-terminal-related transcriptional regulator [Chloroflexota bacterium]